MKRALLLLMIAGCASKTVVEDRTIKSVPPQLIAETGASLYVLDGPDDWLDGSSDMLIMPKPVPWLGENGLRRVLRYGLSHKQVRFVGHADFQPTSGHPMEVTLFNPDAEAQVRGSESHRIGFRVRLKAVFAKEPDHVDMEWTVEQLTDIPGTVGRDGRRGESRRKVEEISSGSETLPLRGTLLLRHPKGDDRVYFILLRIASLEQP